jgi:PAS domain S-box-containing protein
MPLNKVDGFDLNTLAKAVDSLPVGITIIDTEGNMLYFNDQCSLLLDRKPEYLGRNVRLCHKKDGSNEKISRMLEAFGEGRREPYRYRIERNGRRLQVTLTPFEADERFAGCIHSVIPEEA